MGKFIEDAKRIIKLALPSMIMEHIERLNKSAFIFKPDDTKSVSCPTESKCKDVQSSVSCPTE